MNEFNFDELVLGGSLTALLYAYKKNLPILIDIAHVPFVLEEVPFHWDLSFLGFNKSGTHKKSQLMGGLLAQDVEEIERKYGYKLENETNIITQKSEDGQYGLIYERFVPILIKAVQELSTTVEELKTEITNLKGE